MKQKTAEMITVFIIGGMCYGIIEICNRGYTHISMGVLGGISFMMIHILNGERHEHKIALTAAMAVSAIFITAGEYLTGEILNVNLGMNIWSYRNMPMNIDGQICLPFLFVWFGISYLGLHIDDLVRHFILHNSEQVLIIEKKVLTRV